MEVLRKIILLIVLSPLFTTGQDSTNYKQIYNEKLPDRRILKSNPLNFLSGRVFYTSEYRLALELVNNTSTSSEIAISYLGLSPIFKELLLGSTQQFSNLAPAEPSLRGFRLQFSEKFYWTNSYRQAPHGWYMGPHFSYLNSKLEAFTNGIKQTSTLRIASLNARLGYQYLWRGVYMVDIYIMSGYRDIVRTDESSNGYYLSSNTIIDDFPPSGFQFLAGFNIGFSF